MIQKRIAAACLALAATVPGCTRAVDNAQPVVENRAAKEFAAQLRDKLTVEAMTAHLGKLQEIADAHGGNRAIGTPGYEASVDYVVESLRSRGFDVLTPEFQTRVFTHGDPTLTVGGSAIKAGVLQYSGGTPADGVSGPLVAAPADDTPGCAPADYDGLPVKGAVVLVDRGSCQFSEKQAIAAKLGAIAMVVADNVDEEKMGGTLGENNAVTIPVVSVSKADGARLRSAPGPATVKLDATTRTISARNVIAQTKTGSPQNVVMVGGHLDSVPEGPGINDNGSGIAAVLETALQLGSEAAVNNAVRFGFWGAEEVGIVGSRKYVASLNAEQLKDIALYLNFDMLGSPNPGYFTYDGDQSTELGRDQSPPRIPEGSAGIERTFVGYLKSAGKTAEDTSFDGRSDYDGFTKAGIPAGGLFSGAEEEKSPQQAGLWGGTANAPFDPNYHKPTDTLEHVDRTALDINGRGVAWAVGMYATDLNGRNGIPAREDRTRHVITDR
ncbi:MAG: M28 family metallopeptidase [Mycobacterium sp.]|nr:M28 family metallopeptidase [Mycobacterium sp.]